MKKLIILLLGLWIFQTPATAADLNYSLTPKKIADGVYAFIGKFEIFNRKNGGNIVNTGFIIGETGVILIDSGPSLMYGLEMRKAIRTITPKPVTHILITHHHPDHFLGNQAFEGTEILALQGTIDAINGEGEGLLENMFYLVGDWMINTEVVNASKAITTSKMNLAGRTLTFIPMHGHTAADLVILDDKTGSMFTGDLAFYNRTATTPHADLDQWIIALENLVSHKFTQIVPGHGPVEKDGRSLRQTKDYLTWLKATLRQAAKDGLEMTEVMRIPTPDRFKSLRLARIEFHRSVAHLWPAIVEETLPQLD